MSPRNKLLNRKAIKAKAVAARRDIFIIQGLL
jgi:hypothetical protein